MKRGFIVALQMLGVAMAFFGSLYLVFYAFVGLWMPRKEGLRVLFAFSPFLVAACWKACQRLDRKGRTTLATAIALGSSLIPIAIFGIVAFA